MASIHTSFHAIYVDRRATGSRVEAVKNSVNGNAAGSDDDEHSDVVHNIRTLLSVFATVSVCTSSQSCISTITDIERVESGPTLVVLDVPLQSQPGEDDSSTVDTKHDSGVDTDVLYGLPLLKFLCREIDSMRLSNKFIPIALLSNEGSAPTPQSANDIKIGPIPQNRELQCIDNGAFDATARRLTTEKARDLYMHCYRLGSSTPTTRWAKIPLASGKAVEVRRDENDNFAYLREEMVSELMDEICKPKVPKVSSGAHIRIPRTRVYEIREAVGKWGFSAHDYSEEELVFCAQLMFEHAFKMPEVADYRISPGYLTEFLLACRDAYRSDIPYHNFRHVVDVLQAIFYFLLQTKVLPSYGEEVPAALPAEDTLSRIITPLDGLTLLIVAVGHDVGHPGVNNGFLVTLKAPIAQVYNDRSVLESFHCAAFSQLLRKYWPRSLDMRKSMIDLILATDMGLHFDYMGKLDKLRKRFEKDPHHEWDAKCVTEHKNLLCALLIKCADISNVARKHDVSAKWAKILIDEFARQAGMESELGISSSLVAPPVTGSVLALARSQVGFMNLFAFPLFDNLSKVLPEMHFSVEELGINRDKWQAKIQELVPRPSSIKEEKPASPPPETPEKPALTVLTGPRPLIRTETGRVPPVLGTVLMESDMPRSSDATPSVTSGGGGASREDLPLRGVQNSNSHNPNQSTVTVVVTQPSHGKANGYNPVLDKKPTYQYSSEHLRGTPPSDTSSSPDRPRSSPPEFGDASELSCQKGCCGPTVVTNTVERRSSRFFNKIKVWKSWKRETEH